MTHQTRVIFLLVAVGLAAMTWALVGTSLLGTNQPPTLQWDVDDELVVESQDDMDTEPASASSGLEQTPVRAVIDPDPIPVDERTMLLLRGRVIDRFRAPVANAKVWLEYRRGGPRTRFGQQRLVPDPVTTDRDGRFAFLGVTFRNLSVTLAIAHNAHATSHFDRDLGEVGAELDLGEFVMSTGTEFLGRVTDLAGNSVAGAQVTLQARGRSSRRFSRTREQQRGLPTQQTDSSGYYRLPHVPAGDWRVRAVAPRHQQGSSNTYTAEEDSRVEIDDIKLGPGYRLTGIVTDPQDQPIAGANVIARATPLPGGERRRTSNYRTGTDRRGEFLLDHLPGTQLDVTVDKDGYLPKSHPELDPRLGQTLYVTLLDGLRIAGHVVDAKSNEPVTYYAVTVERLRSLERPPREPELFARLRDSRLSAAERQALERQLSVLRSATRSRRMGRGWQTSRSKPEQHPGGAFLETGLQEGVYAVVVAAPTHANFRSAEIELRSGSRQPEVEVRLEAGHAVRGVVLDGQDTPIADARVELQTAEPNNDRDNVRAHGDLGLGDWSGRIPRRGGMTTTSDARGRFAFEHVSAGQYLVRASSRGRDEARTEPFRLDSDVANLELMLGDLGRLEGRVLGANGEQHERVRVFALPAEADISSLFRGNSRQMVTARPDGTYLFDRLKPGDYVVRATTGDGMRSLFREFLSGTPRAEVTVLANRTARLDVTVKIALTGTIRGSVTQNGMPGKGLRVSLVRQGGSLPDGPAPGPHLRNMSNRWSSSSNTVVGDNGEFERDELTVGTYQLTISAGRRSGALHSETVMVSANEISLVSIALVTAAIRGQITTDDGSSPDQLSGSLMLLPNLTELPGDLDAWRRDNQTFNARVSEGRFEVAALPPGIYLAVLTVRGHERTTAQVAANLGPPQPVQIPVGRKTESGNGR